MYYSHILKALSTSIEKKPNGLKHRFSAKVTKKKKVGMRYDKAQV